MSSAEAFPSASIANAAWKPARTITPAYYSLGQQAGPRDLFGAPNEYAVHRIAPSATEWHGIPMTDIASQLAAWTQGTKMLTYTPDTFSGFAHDGTLMLVEDTKTGAVVGAGAVTAQYGNGQVEVGAMIVDPDYRHTAGEGRKGKGVGVVLALALSQLVHDEFDGKQPIAFANPFSHAVFAMLGAVDLPGSAVDPAAFELCGNCTNRPAESTPDNPLCCDQPVSLDAAPVSPALFTYAVVAPDLVFWVGDAGRGDSI